MSVNNDSYSLFFVLLIWMLVSFSIEPAFFLAVVALVSLFFFIKNRAAFAIDLPGSVVLLTLLMAVIGVVIGYFNGNNTSYILRNAGGVFFFIAYFFFTSLPFERLQTILGAYIKWSYFYFAASFLYLFLFVLFSVRSSVLQSILGQGHGSGIEGSFRYYTVGIFVLLPFAFYLMFGFRERSVKTGKLMLEKLIGLIVLLSIFILSFSKGIALLFIVMIVVFMIRNFLFKHGRFLLVVLFSAVGFYSFQSYFFDSLYGGLFLNIVSEDGTGNIQRLDQVNDIIDELTFFGHGYGATFESFTRSHDAPYGSELSFHNLLHKNGVFSIFFFSHLLIIFYQIKRYISGKMTVSGALLLGAYSYWLPAIGNPILFHPVLVICHSFFLAYYSVSSKYK